MSNKTVQIKRIRDKFKEQGFVSRNYFINLPYDKITRLSEYIRILRHEEGWEIDMKEIKTETGKDTIYTVTKRPMEERFEIVEINGVRMARKILEEPNQNKLL